MTKWSTEEFTGSWSPLLSCFRFNVVMDGQCSFCNRVLISRLEVQQQVHGISKVLWNEKGFHPQEEPLFQNFCRIRINTTTNNIFQMNALVFLQQFSSAQFRTAYNVIIHYIYNNTKITINRSKFCAQESSTPSFKNSPDVANPVRVTIVKQFQFSSDCELHFQVLPLSTALSSRWLMVWCHGFEPPGSVSNLSTL